MSIRYHGNNCGPGWSGGKWQQSSLDAAGTAVDEFDKTCEDHDLAYARGQDLVKADIAFARKNLSKFDPKRNFAGALVGVQGLGRKIIQSLYDNPDMTKKSKSKDQVKQLMSEIRMNAALNKPTRKKRTRLPPIDTSLAPTAISRQVSMAKPSILHRNGKIIVKHSEYITNVTVETSFTVSSYRLNPGLQDVFPWLSNIASQYDRYKWKKLTFAFIPSASTSTDGRVTMAIARDPTQEAPASKLQIFQISPNNEASVWSPVEVNYTGSKIMFVRSLLSSNYVVGDPLTDYKTTDDGIMFLATDLGTSSKVVGELYVSYEVELIDPVFNQHLDFGQISSTSSDQENIFDASTAVKGRLLAKSTLPNTIVLRDTGDYVFNVIVEGTGLTATDVFDLKESDSNGPDIIWNKTSSKVVQSATRAIWKCKGKLISTAGNPANLLFTLADGVATISYVSISFTNVSGLDYTTV